MLYYDQGKYGHKKKWLLLSRKRPRRVLRIWNKKPSRKAVLAAERQIQYFKHIRNFGSRPYKTKIYKTYRTRKRGGQHYWINVYKQIVKKARKKGYKLPRYSPGRGPLQITDVDIPASHFVEGFTLPIEEGQKKWSKEEAQKFRNKFLIGLDDDETEEIRKRALAHELAHTHLFYKKIKPHTEYKAEKIGADILGIPLDKFRKDIVFDQDIHKPGIQLPRKIPKKVLKKRT